MTPPSPVPLDLMGLKCPLPALRTAKVLATLGDGAVLSVSCTDPLAAIDIPHLIRQTGDELVSQQAEAGVLTFVIRRRRA